MATATTHTLTFESISYGSVAVVYTPLQTDVLSVPWWAPNLRQVVAQGVGTGYAKRHIYGKSPTLTLPARIAAQTITSTSYTDDQVLEMLQEAHEFGIDTEWTDGTYAYTPVHVEELTPLMYKCDLGYELSIVLRRMA